MATDHDTATSSAAGCGGGGCGCGGDRAQTTNEVPVLSVDPRLDVREIPHDERHSRIFTALDGVPLGGALVLVAPHAPRPLLEQLQVRNPGQFGVEWLQSGPEVWQVRLQRAVLPA